MFRTETDKNADQIVDPPTGKKYEWDKPLTERIHYYSKEQFLHEVKDE